MRRLITIPCGGRPPKVYPQSYWQELLTERQSMTVTAMADLHGVSVGYMSRLIRRAEAEIEAGDSYGRESV